MYRLQVFAICVMLAASVSAQRHFPLPADNPFWTEEHGMLWACSTMGIHGSCDGYFCRCTTPVYYKADTVINGMVYNRLYSRGVCDAFYAGGQPPEGCPFGFSYEEPESLFAILRQDTINQLVYILENTVETVLYDYKNLVVGNDYPQTYNTFFQPDTLVVASLDSILLGNEYHKKWGLGIRQNGGVIIPGFVSIIEGVGSTFGIKSSFSFPFENSDRLNCFSMHDIVLYPDSSYTCDKTVNVPEMIPGADFSVFPNPSSDKLTVNKANGAGNCYLNILTVTGQVVMTIKIIDASTQIDISSLENGVYLAQLQGDSGIQTIKFIKIKP